MKIGDSPVIERSSVHDMFARVSRRYDLANDVLSLGIHRLWRKEALACAGVATGQTVLDLCTGTGDLAFAAAQNVGPRGKVLALDFVQEMLVIAQAKRSRNSLLRDVPIEFIRGDALKLPLSDNSIDVATIAFGIRNVEDPLSCLVDIRRVLRSSGTALILEFGRPTLPVFSLLYRLYSTYLMPSLGSLLTGDRSAYEYLPRTSREFPAGDAFLELLKNAGFTSLSVKPLLTGVAYIYTGVAP